MALNLRSLTIHNENYRQVVLTTSNQQIVVMSICDFIPLEDHTSNDQFIKIEQGCARVELPGLCIYDLKEGDSITIPAGTCHKVTNTSESGSVKLYTIYSPPHHRPDLIHKTRSDDKS